MRTKKRTSQALALLVPTGVLGISAALAGTQAEAEKTLASTASGSLSVAERLSEIRHAVSLVHANTIEDAESGVRLTLADWVNFGGGFGWRNGGWRNWGNGGWGNGGWHNGGWGNGGWGNGGWHNWHNFWHNW